MTDTKLTKSAGEHWVCSVLSGLGWGAALTRDGLERTDVLAVRTGDSRVVIEVQVKSASHSVKPNWRVGTKAQQVALADHEWFVMIALAAQPWVAPRSFVVPRDHIAAAAFIRHQGWLTDPSVEPGKRNTGLDQARLYVEDLLGYEDRWDLLHLRASAAPVLLDKHMRELAVDERVGLPPGHPWLSVLPAW
jgi:hypothetical protein